MSRPRKNKSHLAQSQEPLSRPTPSIKAKKIKRVREELRLNQNVFGKLCGFESLSIGRMERGDYGILYDGCRRVAESFGVRIDWLLDDSRSVDETDIFVAKHSSAAPEEQGARLRIVIEESGLSQRQFIAKLNGNTMGLHSKLSGEQAITLRFAEKIEREFGVGVDWLLYGVEESKEAPCDSAMIAWLKLHPEWRKKIREEMMKSPLDTMISQ